MRGWIALAMLFSAPVAMAHEGHSAMASIGAGFMHPLTGPDHLAAMLAVGLWGALTAPGWPRAARAPLVFALALLAGGWAAMVSGWVPWGIEPGIAVSLLGLGLLVAWRIPLPEPLVLLMVALFALAHGAAHGLELTNPLALVGMVGATVLLHALGLGFGLLMRSTALRWREAVGALLMTFGALRLAGVL
jgi:urease accessory protein